MRSGSKKSAKEKDLIAYGVYARMFAAQKHYTLLQVTCRIIASTWLLAIFAAIGFIFSSKVVELPFDPFALVICIAAAGIIGVLILWYEDLIVYQRSLGLAVLEVVKLEDKYAWLPESHRTMIAFSHKKGFEILKTNYYIGCLAILIALIGGVLAIWSYEYHPLYLLPLFFACLGVVWSAKTILAKLAHRYSCMRLMGES